MSSRWACSNGNFDLLVVVEKAYWMGLCHHLAILLGFEASRVGLPSQHELCHTLHLICAVAMFSQVPMAGRCQMLPVHRSTGKELRHEYRIAAGHLKHTPHSPCVH
jgi:hypothetical protein